MDSQKYFKQKYLKYKQKYLEIKKFIGGVPPEDNKNYQNAIDNAIITRKFEEEEQRRKEQEQIRAKQKEEYRLLEEKKRDLILKFNKIKFTKEECTANVLDIKAFIDFNYYIDKEIDFFSGASDYIPLGKLFAPIINSYNEEIIYKYIVFRQDFRPRLKYISDAEEDELFSQLYNLKFTIKGEEKKREEKVKSDLMLRFDEIKFKKEKCTALLGFKGKCKKAIVEFNNYIDQEIAYLSTNNSDNFFKDALNKLSETISSSDEKKIMNGYIEFRNKKFIQLGKSKSLQHDLFSYLQKIKSLILSL